MENNDKYGIAKKIRKKGFIEGTKEAKVEEYCIEMASCYTDELLKKYSTLAESRDGRYINSDLMKMIFPFYAKKIENRRLYNMSISNTSAVLTNEAYERAIRNGNVKKCIYITGPYGAGKSYFTQSLFENDKEDKLKDSIVYEGSITPPAFEEKIQFAIEHGVEVFIIALNPTLELSIKNIKERANRIGRDVEKKEVLDKFSNFYTYMKQIIEKFGNITFGIYNKKSNEDIKIGVFSKELDDLYHGTPESIEKEYDRIIETLNTSKNNTDNEEAEIGEL